MGKINQTSTCNYINKTLSDKLDCQYKTSFIGSVNKLIANFGNLQQDVIAKLFKSYCCLFYGSQAWQIDSTDVTWYWCHMEQMR